MSTATAPAAAPSSTTAPAPGQATQQPGAQAEAGKGSAPGAAGGAAQAAATQKTIDEILKEGIELKAGKDRRVKVNSIEQLTHYAQKAFGAEKAFEERNTYEQQLQQFKAALKDPKALRDLLAKEAGVDPRKLAEDWVWEQVEQEKLTPEQQKLRQLEQWKAEREKQDAEAKQKQAEAEEAERIKALQDHLAGVYHDALVKADIPPEVAPWFIPRIAKLADQLFEAEVQPDPAQLAELAIRDFRQEQAAIIGKLDGPALVSMLGEDVVNKIRKFDLARLRERSGQRPAPAQNPLAPKPQSSNPNRPVDPWAAIDEKIKNSR
jgi:hypothetical protein